MIKKILLGLLVLVVLFLGYVSTRSGEFKYERSGVINAPASRIFPYLSNFKMGSQWSPYEKMDPNMKKTYVGTDGQVGSIMEFEGNKDTGSGRLEMLKIVLNELIEIKLTMLKPMHGENLVRYKLSPEGTGTRFSWSIEGNGGFMSKLFTLLVDCEKMMGEQFEQGIATLRGVVEGAAAAH